MENVETEYKWVRSCPECGKDLIYSLKRTFACAVKKQSVCHTCSRKYCKSKKFKRNCSICNGDIWYASKFLRDYSINKPCKKCSHIGLKYNTHPQVYSILDRTRKCPNCGIDIVYKSMWKRNCSEKFKKICHCCGGKIATQFRKPYSSYTLLKMSQYRKGKTYKELGIVCDLVKRGKVISDSKRGISLTKEHRKALRDAKIKWLINNNFTIPSFNKKACKYMDELNKQKGWNLQHALNGGEKQIYGYFVDGYDEEKNIIVEYDEPYHNKSLQILKDNERMDEIKKYLHCKFYRYNVSKNELKEY